LGVSSKSVGSRWIATTYAAVLVKAPTSSPYAAVLVYSPSMYVAALVKTPGVTAAYLGFAPSPQ
jgi:hypothetical protein